MKNRSKFLIIVFLLLAVVFVCPHTESVSAEVVDKNYIVESSDVDERLYGNLCDIKKGETGSNVTTLCQKDFINLTELDLTIDYKLSSLGGLNNFYFDNLQVLNISGNKLKSISKDVFSTMPNLKTLNLAGNLIENIDISNLLKLTAINLSSNNLTQINLSNIKNSAEINLANNNFDSIGDIVLPNTTEEITINIISNNITDIPDSYLNSNIKFKGGIQGLKSSSTITSTQANGITYYNSNIEGLSVKIFKKSNNEVVKTITDNDGENISLNLGVGRYYYRYYINDVLAYDDGDLNDQRNLDKKIYKGYDFVILPNAPTYTLEHKGKTYSQGELGKVTGAVTINIAKSNENDVVYYKVVSNGEWIQGDKVVCDKGGNYSVVIKTVCIVDGEQFESEEVSVFIKTSLNKLIPDILMLVIVLAITLTLFFVVTPIISKKFFKKNKR